MGLSEAARQAGWASSQGLAGDPVGVKAELSQGRPTALRARGHSVMVFSYTVEAMATIVLT